MKSIFTFLLAITTQLLYPQSTLIKKTSFSSDNYYRFQNGEFCGPQITAIIPNGSIATYVKINPDESKLFLFDSSVNVTGQIFTSYNSGMQFNIITDLIATPDSGFLYSTLYANPSFSVWNSGLVKRGVPGWNYSFPSGYMGEEIYDLYVTAEGNYACQGRDSLYIISPYGIRILNAVNTPDILINNYTNSDKLIKHQQFLERRDSTGNILWSIPYGGYYAANDSFLYAVGSDTIRRLDPSNGFVLWASFAPGACTGDFTFDGGYAWLNSIGQLGVHNSAGQQILSKDFPFALRGITQIRKHPSGVYFIGGAYPSNAFMYADNKFSSFVATLDSSFNGLVDSTSVFWPMDSNHDRIVSYSDIARLNLAYGAQGHSREPWPSNIGLEPYLFSDYATDWSGSFCDGLNYKYSDSNGDGSVDSLDFQCYEDFYWYPYPVSLRKRDIQTNLPTSTFSLIPNASIVFPGDTIRFYFVLSDSLLGLDTLSAFAFDAIDYSGFTDIASIRIEALDNELGLIPELRIAKNMVPPSSGALSFGFMMARLDKQDRYYISDTIGYVEFKISTLVPFSQTLTLYIRSISALSNCGIERSILPVNGQVYIQVGTSSVEVLIPLEVKLSPNPCDREFTLELNRPEKKRIRISDLLGKTIIEFISSETTIKIPVYDLQNGVYLLTVDDNTSHVNRKIIVQHK